MKKLVLCLLLLAASSPLLAQNFEGTVVYSLDARLLTKNPDHPDSKAKLAALKRMIPDSIVCVYRGNQYTNMVYGQRVERLVYDPKTVSAYCWVPGESHCNIRNMMYDHNNKTQPKVTLLDTTVIVDGRVCKGVRLTWETMTIEYFYSPGYMPFNAAAFAQHGFTGWNAYLKAAGCIPMQSFQILDGTVAILTVKSVKAHSVPDSEFALPNLYPPTKEEKAEDTAEEKTRRMKR